ncbi:MAG: hypothetical protein AB7H97_10905 [Pseudobdellovibrionaceae bacterium]
MNPSREQIEAQLIQSFNEAAEKLNTEGPVMIGDGVRRERTEVGPGLNITYFISLRNFASTDIDVFDFQSSLITELRENVCKSKEMIPALKFGAGYSYVYTGTDDVEVARVTIRKHDCPELN